MTAREWLALAVLVAPLAGVASRRSWHPRRWLVRVESAIAVLTRGHSGVRSLSLRWQSPASVSSAGGSSSIPQADCLLGVIGAVGLASALVSPQYLAGRRGSLFRAERADRIYWATLFAFWAVLLAVPLAGNLGAAWLAIEATTAASALLVGFSGRGPGTRGRLEVPHPHLARPRRGAARDPRPRGGGGGWRPRDADLARAAAGLARSRDGGRRLRAAARRARSQDRLGAGPQLAAGRPLRGARPGLGASLRCACSRRCCSSPGARSRHSHRRSATKTAGGVLVGFGLVSLAVAVPFLWRPQAWKRLLAYSSLEHMGVIALGIGFGGPLALAGVAIHIVGHALAKALGFYAATPLLAHDPRAAGHAVGGIGRTQPALGASLGISLGALAGLPPSPLFVSEVLIVAGGFQVGRPWAASAAAILLALGFLGLAHALIDTVVGRPRGPRTPCCRRCRSGVDPDSGRRAAVARPHGRGAVASRLGDRPRPRAGARMSAPAQGGIAYREAVAAALADGWRFAGLHATADGSRPARAGAARLVGGRRSGSCHGRRVRAA